MRNKGYKPTEIYVDVPYCTVTEDAAVFSDENKQHIIDVLFTVQKNMRFVQDEYDTCASPNHEAALIKTAKQYRYKTVDAYGSFVGKDFIVLNAYGQEDGWEEGEYDIVALDTDGIVYILEYKDASTNVFTKESGIPLNIKDFGGKRGYYYTKDKLVRFRTDEEFYKTLPIENKYPEGEKDVSGPHFTIRF